MKKYYKNVVMTLWIALFTGNVCSNAVMSTVYNII